MNLVQLFTTENQTLIFIIKALSIALQGFFFYKNADIIFNSKPNKNEKFGFIFIVTFIGILADFIPTQLVLIRDFINLTFIILSLHYILKQSLINSIIILVVSYLEVFLSGSFSQTILINLFKIPLESLISIPIYYIITYFLSSFIWGLMIYLLYGDL